MDSWPLDLAFAALLGCSSEGRRPLTWLFLACRNSLIDVGSVEEMDGLEATDGREEETDGLLAPGGPVEETDGLLARVGPVEDMDGLLAPVGPVEDMDGLLALFGPGEGDLLGSGTTRSEKLPLGALPTLLMVPLPAGRRGALKAEGDGRGPLPLEEQRDAGLEYLDSTDWLRSADLMLNSLEPQACQDEGSANSHPEFQVRWAQVQGQKDDTSTQGPQREAMCKGSRHSDFRR